MTSCCDLIVKGLALHVVVSRGEEASGVFCNLLVRPAATMYGIARTRKLGKLFLAPPLGSYSVAWVPRHV